jgi:hypothetical protein
MKVTSGISCEESFKLGRSGFFSGLFCSLYASQPFLLCDNSKSSHLFLLSEGLPGCFELNM